MSGRSPISAKSAIGDASVILPQKKSQRSRKRVAEREARAAKLLNGASVPASMPEGDAIERVMLTPELAVQLLEHNSLNRPISDVHVGRIARQIIDGKWRYNADTIKISAAQEVLDGQHRLWAVIEAQMPVETVIAYGIERDAFATIDTVRRLRTGGDTVALNGARNYRNQIATALAWMLRWQRGVLETYKVSENRIENADIEATFRAHPGIQRAAEAAMKVRQIANAGIVAFCYYVMSNQSHEIAEAYLRILTDPSEVGVNHPFFRLRSYFLTDKLKQKDPIMSIALTFKAANLVKQGKQIQTLVWRSQGNAPEPYPVLNLSAKD